MNAKTSFYSGFTHESGAYQTCSYVSMNRVIVKEGKSPLSISGEHEFKWYLQMDLL